MASDDARDEKHLRMLKSTRLGERLQAFQEKLESGKDVGWEDFYRALRWLSDPDKIRGWTRVLQLCKEHEEEKRMWRGEEIVITMKPWKNPKIWQPFLQDLYIDLNAALKEEGDILSLVAYKLGHDYSVEQRDATGLYDFIKAKAKRKKGD